MQKRPLTIAFVTNNYTPYQGGVVSAIKAYMHALQQRGHRVIIVTLGFRDGSNDNHVIPVYCPLHFNYKFGPLAIPWRSAKEISAIFNEFKPDIVHIHHPFLLGSAALSVCRKQNIATIFTYHTQYDNCLHYAPLPSFILRPIVWHLVQRFCADIDCIIAPSTFVKEQLKIQEITNPIKVLPSPILPIFAHNLPKFRYKQPHTIIQLLYVGRFTPEKNIPLLLQLIKELGPGFHLTIAGYGHLEQFLHNYAYEILKLSHHHVMFIRNPNKTTLCKLYKESDIFVFASVSESQALVLAEAMAGATPIVVLKGNWQNEQVIDGVNGFWVDNLAQMKERIITISNNMDLFRQLQSGAWQTSRRFHAEILTQQLENIYHQTIIARFFQK